MLSIQNPSGYPFPDEFVPPKKKEQAEYGLAAVRAMYFSQNRLGYGQIGLNDQYTALTELAQGRQSTQKIRQLLGFHDVTASPFGTNDNNASLAYIDVQVLNLATKYVNKAVSKLQRNKYDLSLSAVDPFSVSEAQEYNNKIKAYYQLRDWYKLFGKRINPQDFFPDLDLNLLPEYPEELIFNMSVNEKIKRIIDGEKTLKLVNHTINDQDQIQRECDWDTVVYGHSHVHCYLDENGIPRNDRINPRFWGGSFVNNEDYSKQEYSFFVDFITRNQFKKEAEGKLSADQIDKVLKSNATPNAIATYGTLPEYYTNYDGLKWIPVVRFYFLSNDNVTYVKRKTTEENKAVDVVPYEYSPKNPNKTAMPASYTSVYGGTWVIDSDVVYNYGRKDIPRTKLVNARLPIISFAPNQKEGRLVSMLSQMIEPIFMINVVHQKIKDILARESVGPIELNLSAIENIALGSGGVAWTPEKVIELYEQKKIIITREVTSPYGQKNGNSFTQHPATVTLADYFTTMQRYILVLDDLTGSTLADSTDVPDRLGVGVLKANLAAGAESIEYLINARQKRYEQVSHMNLLLTQAAKKNKVKISGMIPALGKYTTEFFEVPDELPYCEYGLQMVPEPSPEEWAQFYVELQKSVEIGRLNSSDSAFIRSINNLKIARQVMANRELVNEKKAQAMKQQEQQFQREMAFDLENQKHKNILEQEEVKRRNALEIKRLEAMIAQKLDEQEQLNKRSIQQASDVTKLRATQDTNQAVIIKEAMRSNSTETEAQLKSMTDVATSRMQAEQKERERKIKEKQKPKK